MLLCPPGISIRVRISHDLLCTGHNDCGNTRNRKPATRPVRGWIEAVVGESPYSKLDSRCLIIGAQCTRMVCDREVIIDNVLDLLVRTLSAGSEDIINIMLVLKGDAVCRNGGAITAMEEEVPKEFVRGASCCLPASPIPDLKGTKPSIRILADAILASTSRELVCGSKAWHNKPAYEGNNERNDGC